MKYMHYFRSEDYDYSTKHYSHKIELLYKDLSGDYDFDVKNLFDVSTFLKGYQEIICWIGIRIR